MPDPMGLENILAMYLAGVAKRNQTRGETPYTLSANDDRQPFIHFVEPPRVNYVKKPSKVKPGAKTDPSTTVTEKDFLTPAQMGEISFLLDDLFKKIGPQQAKPEPIPFNATATKQGPTNQQDPAAKAMADFEAAVRGDTAVQTGQNGPQMPNPFDPAPAPVAPGANPAVIAAITESGLDVNDPLNAPVIAQLSRLSPATIMRLGQQIAARGYKGNDTKSMWSDLASVMA